MKVHQFYSLLRPPEGDLVIPQVRDRGWLLPRDQDQGSEQTSAVDSIKLSLIIPTYNERETLPDLLWQLTRQLDAQLPGAYEIIVVDDNSRDRTWQIAANLMAQHLQLWVMRRRREQGLATAVVRGWQASRGQVLGVMDADFQHPPDVLAALLDAVDRGADLALATRHAAGGGVSNWSLGRRLLSRGAQVLGLLLLPGVVGRVSDPMSGYFLVRREAIAGASLYPLSYKILLEVLARGQVGRIAEVGYVFCDRKGGRSKVHWRQYRDYLLHLARLRWALLPWRFLRFALVGCSGVLVDMLALYGCLTLGWSLTPSKLVAAQLAMVNNFIWNDCWTFGDLRGAEMSAGGGKTVSGSVVSSAVRLQARSQGSQQQRQRWKQRFQRFLKFNAICSVGVVLNLTMLQLLVRGPLPNPYAANLVAIVLTTLWNYWINFKLNWRTTTVRQLKDTLN